MSAPPDLEYLDKLGEICFRRGIKRLQFDDSGLVLAIEMGVTLNPNFEEKQGDVPLPRSAHEGTLEALADQRGASPPSGPPSTADGWFDAIPEGVPVLRRDGLAGGAR